MGVLLYIVEKCHLSYIRLDVINTNCVPELFAFIFHSFEAGIAAAISSFKWRRMCFIYEKTDTSWIELFIEVNIYHKLFYHIEWYFTWFENVENMKSS